MTRLRNVSEVALYMSHKGVAMMRVLHAADQTSGHSETLLDSKKNMPTILFLTVSAP